MDYRKFLGRAQESVLPYLGGNTVRAEDRRLRLREQPGEGWWRFSIEGRYASAISEADPPELARLPSVKGAYASGWLFVSGSELHRLFLLPTEELPPFAPITARRWHSGDVLFECQEFETETEETIRRAFEDGAALVGLAGVTPGLRVAYAFALVVRTGQRLGVQVSPREVLPRAMTISERGAEEAEEFLADLSRRRNEQRLQSVVSRSPARHVRRSSDSIERRAEDALDAAGATLLATRRLENDLLEVTFRFLGERFVSLVDANTFQVVDSGICLSGTDREVNLKSLPGVIREAIDTDELFITRH